MLINNYTCSLSSNSLSSSSSSFFSNFKFSDKDFIDISRAPVVEIINPIIILIVNLLFFKIKYDRKANKISLELLNSCVNNDEFFSLLNKNDELSIIHKEQLIKR